MLWRSNRRATHDELQAQRRRAGDIVGRLQCDPALHEAQEFLREYRASIMSSKHPPEVIDERTFELSVRRQAEQHVREIHDKLARGRSPRPTAA